MTTGPASDAFAWDAEIEVLVRVRVKATPNPEYFDGLDGRTVENLAVHAVLHRGNCALPYCDGWADMFGTAYVVDADLL